MTQSERSKVPSFLQVWRMVFSSAWAVGSLSKVSLLTLPATISPVLHDDGPEGIPTALHAFIGEADGLAHVFFVFFCYSHGILGLYAGVTLRFTPA